MKNNTESQKNQVKEHLKKYSKIDVLIAFNQYQIMRLSHIIYLLRNEGLPITTERKKLKSGKIVADYVMNI